MINNYTILQPSSNFASAPETDILVPINLESSQREINESDRNTYVNLQELYNNERQTCTIFRPTYKFSFIYDNNLVGYAKYNPFRDSLGYVNQTQSLLNGQWSGYPSHSEFDVIRYDTDNQHVTYKPVSATSYNWNFYISYVFSSLTNYNLTHYFGDDDLVTWNISDGLPFKITTNIYNGLQYISFNCPMPHGLSVGESVKLSLTYDDVSTFQVDLLGNEQYGSDKYVFNIIDVGYTGFTFSNGAKGTFKRVINSENPQDSTSNYYIRLHKILKTPSQMQITKAGFEENPFNKKQKYEFSALTPNGVGRISTRQFTNSYVVTPKSDVDTLGLVDNHQIPITELYLSTTFKGYMGWFNKPRFGNFGLKKGWGYSIFSGNTSRWWDDTNNSNVEDISLNSYRVTTGGTNYDFYYLLELSEGDIIHGDICEYNNTELVEIVRSNYFHKLNFNPDLFDVSSTQTTNPSGYYYSVHQPLKIRELSSYIESSDSTGTFGVPNYAYYSNTNGNLSFREIYDYGFIDNENNGVDFPFLNQSHYPTNVGIFRLIPEGGNFEMVVSDLITQPLNDDCE